MSYGRLIGFICEKHGYINCEETGEKICPDCRQEKKGKAPNINLISPDIDRKCREEGTAVLGVEEARREAERNKAYNREKTKHEFRKHFDKEVRRII